MTNLTEPDNAPQRLPLDQPSGASQLPTYKTVFAFYGLVVLAAVVSQYIIVSDWGGVLFPIACVLPLIILRRPVAPKDDNLQSSASTVMKSLSDGLIVSVLFLVPFLLLVYFVPVFRDVSPKSEPYWSSWTEVLNDAFSMLVSVAIFEELFFRGFMQDNLARLLNDRKPIFGATLGRGYLLACALFALPHVLSWGSKPLGLMTFFSSLVFGWLYAKRRCIAGAVICHTAFNVVPAVFHWIIRY